VDLTGGVEMPDIEADIFFFFAFSNQVHQIKEVSQKLKGKFAIFGPFATYGKNFLKGFTMIRGEAELSCLKMIQDFPNCQDEYLQGETVDPNFFPDWDAIDLSKYGYSLMGKRCISMMTKRGECPYRCSFCCKYGKSPIRNRTAENVLEECRLLRDKGFGAIAIYDDDVLLDKKRDYEIFKGLKELGMPYRCMTRSNIATMEDLQMLKDTGCGEVAVGIEAIDPYIHDVVARKMTTAKQDTDFILNCKKIGLNVKAYLIIGLPSESEESVEKIREWLREVKPTNFDVSIFTPYPGSDIYENKEKYDIFWEEDKLREILFDGKAQYDDCAVSTSHLSSKRILELREEILNEFKRGKGGSTNYWKPYEKNKC
jgi:radical SAM superfamily enzyme YgiQ (UPF0313 family)